MAATSAVNAAITPTGFGNSTLNSIYTAALAGNSNLT